MEFRRLISFGKSSFVVSLPKSWVRRNKLKKSDFIYIAEKDEELVLSPKADAQQEEKRSITIDIDGKDYFQIKREIIPAYINHYHTITVVGKELRERSKDVREILHNLVALEIMEQTAEKIVAKDFLNMERIDMGNLMRKMDVIIRAMMSDSILNFEENSYENLKQRDQDVNRLAFLLFRAIRYAYNNPAILKLYKCNNIDLLTAWQLANAMEKFADETKRVARLKRNFKFSRQQQQELLPICREIEKSYLMIMKAYYNSDKGLAYQVAGRRRPLMAQINEMAEKHRDETSMIYMTEKLKGLVANCNTITRIVYT
ncbi:phosphate uptake regulator PhoU [Candidatus Woesearchaeota archaeon]|nr:phosphate uptake regulator PhoU [Candidatus Woesearchaeota archaeon]